MSRTAAGLEVSGGGPANGELVLDCSASPLESPVNAGPFALAPPEDQRCHVTQNNCDAAAHCPYRKHIYQIVRRKEGINDIPAGAGTPLLQLHPRSGPSPSVPSLRDIGCVPVDAFLTQPGGVNFTIAALPPVLVPVLVTHPWSEMAARWRAEQPLHTRATFLSAAKDLPGVREGLAAGLFRSLDLWEDHPLAPRGRKAPAEWEWRIVPLHLVEKDAGTSFSGPTWWQAWLRVLELASEAQAAPDGDLHSELHAWLAADARVRLQALARRISIEVSRDVKIAVIAPHCLHVIHHPEIPSPEHLNQVGPFVTAPFNAAEKCRAEPPTAEFLEKVRAGPQFVTDGRVDNRRWLDWQFKVLLGHVPPWYLTFDCNHARSAFAAKYLESSPSKTDEKISYHSDSVKLEAALSSSHIVLPVLVAGDTLESHGPERFTVGMSRCRPQEDTPGDSAHCWGDVVIRLKQSPAPEQPSEINR